jgi:hypothetical protein
MGAWYMTRADRILEGFKLGKLGAGKFKRPPDPPEEPKVWDFRPNGFSFSWKERIIQKWFDYWRLKDRPWIDLPDPDSEFLTVWFKIGVRLKTQVVLSNEKNWQVQHLGIYVHKHLWLDKMTPEQKQTWMQPLVNRMKEKGLLGAMFPNEWEPEKKW